MSIGVVIDGGASSVTIDGAAAFGVFNITSDGVQLRNLTIRNGYATYGAGVYAAIPAAAILVFDHCTLTGNVATRYGGALFNTNGIDPDGGTVQINFSTIANNILNGNGGGAGIADDNGVIDLDSSTISGNMINAASSVGGVGIFINHITQSKIAMIRNSTIDNNTTFSSGDGGGINDASTIIGGTLQIISSTISSNAVLGSGGGIVSGANGVISLQQTIVAYNTDGAGKTDLAGVGVPMLSSGSNLIQFPAAGAFTLGTGDLIGVDPQLVGLANNGGATQTRALNLSSPAIGAVMGTCAVMVDQRGVARPGTSCDIGAYETMTATPTPTLTDTPTETVTPTASPSATPTFTISPTVTETLTTTALPSATSTMTITPSATLTSTSTPTITVSPTSTVLPSATLTPSETLSATVTVSASPSATLGATRTTSPTVMTSATVVASPTRTFGATRTVTSTASPGAFASNTPGVTAPSLSIMMVCEPTLAQPGDTVTFAITLVNQGNATASGVIVSDRVPQALRLIAGTASQGTFTISGAFITFNIGAIAPSQSVTLRIVTVVRADAPIPSDIVNVVRLDYDGGTTTQTTASATVHLTHGLLPTTGEHPTDPATGLFGALWALGLIGVVGCLYWLRTRRLRL